MRRRLPRNSLAAYAALAVLTLAALLAAWRLMAPDRDGQSKALLGLFTTLPIYWGEPQELGDLLAPARQPGWVRARLEQDYRLRPLDVLTTEALAPLRLLLAAQPRALSPAENVALDGWVRGGGRLLLFADPLLTAQSAFPLGDRRRPQSAALLSPILAHWGLVMTFDEAQPPVEREVHLLGAELPVEMSGRFALAAHADPATCRLLAAGLAASCRIGQGRALIVADAALLDGNAPGRAASSEALARLAAEAFGADRG